MLLCNASAWGLITAAHKGRLSSRLDSIDVLYCPCSYPRLWSLPLSASSDGTVFPLKAHQPWIWYEYLLQHTLRASRHEFVNHSYHFIWCVRVLATRIALGSMVSRKLCGCMGRLLEGCLPLKYATGSRMLVRCTATVPLIYHDVCDNPITSLGFDTRRKSGESWWKKRKQEINSNTVSETSLFPFCY